MPGNIFVITNDACQVNFVVPLCFEFSTDACGVRSSYQTGRKQKRSEGAREGAREVASEVARRGEQERFTCATTRSEHSVCFAAKSTGSTPAGTSQPHDGTTSVQRTRARR